MVLLLYLLYQFLYIDLVNQDLKYDDTSNILSLVGALAGGGGAGGSDVPEPSTFVLLFSALGFFGLTYAKRRRQK